MRVAVGCFIKSCLRLMPLALILAFIVSIIGPSIAYADPGWYPDASWHYRKKITINGANVTAPLANFPVMISITSDGALGTHAQLDGDDILFTADDEVTKLSHEIEKYSSNGVTANLTAWVMVPSLPSGTDTDIYMYYGNAGAANQQAATSVWDSNYQMVQHMEETVGGPSAITDSTINGNNGTDNNSPTFGASGKVNGAINFDGINDVVNFGYANSVNITRPLTIETWIKPTTVPGGNTSEPIVFRDDGSRMNYSLSIASGSYVNNTGVKVLFWREDVVDTDNKTYGTTEIAAGNWYHIVIVDAGSQGVAGNFSIYINGGSPEGVLSCNLTAYDGATHKLTIADTNGERIGGGSYFNGTIDEVRISNTVRSAAWIKTSYNNQSNPAAFFTLGAEANNFVAPTVTTNAATNVEETIATLNGTLNSDGGELCQYSFEWGIAPNSYTANISWTGLLTTGSIFSQPLGGLTKGQPYYYRAKVMNSAGIAYGGEIHFLTKPEGPVVLNATANSSSRIDLTWTKSASANRTMIRRSEIDYPASHTDGDEVYFDTGTIFSDTSLSANTTYYYSAWSEVNASPSQWSNTFVQASAKTLAAGPSPPTVIGGKVFSVNKAVILAPWLLLGAALSLLIIRLVSYFRKKSLSRPPPRKNL
jgi:hypothetical protein